jgi:ABC-2 type transport system ATP-binding protein
MSVIRTENLGKVYRGGAAALESLDLTVEAGEVFGFLGPNGAGKSTTIHLLLNFINATSGVAYLFGEPASKAASRRHLGYLPESVNLHIYYTGRDLLAFYARLQDVPVNVRAGQIDDLLQLVGLQEAADQQVSQYSKGMVQRMGLAQALLGDPELVILDEPTANLDPVGRKEFRDILLNLKGQGKTIFISSHILSEVESVCDRVAILQQGRLRRVGSLEELSRSPGARVVVGYLPGAATEALAATRARIDLAQGQATIHCPDEQVQRQVSGLLERHGVAVERVETEQQSLEEIFFAAIGKEGKA